MPKFAANLSFLYQDQPFLDRFAQAAEDGFGAVEYVSPYEFDKTEVASALKLAGIAQALFNLPPGNWGAGERGIGCLPNRVEEFRRGVDTAIDYARALDCKTVNCLAGLAPAGADAETLDRTLIDNLNYAAPRLADAGIALVIEPINRRDMPTFHLATTDHAERIMAGVSSDNLKIQYDFYHMQIMQGDLVPTFERLQDRIGHVQIADNPGRNEPGTGEINYPYIFSALDRLGYTGWVGCEYKPSAGTSEGLGWMNPYRKER
ncbi:MAG: hydroxypyruvate isomerase [Candidatus Devosia phytovorans]|uniref:Hydroxypyruvate isomerase n=1 Tax=Candidatus Devosia phytovorans TaxID=3121372 RepID=A0AAJ5VYZ5_9HYPH|nr:2-oxo-tetronate isomerase [Devosia sp.]WEK06017.1 MAG: hydroxypyruvate isomerase [Devosia sp.]